jgi:hypothetical protein
MDELFSSGIMLAYPPSYNYVLEYGDEKEAIIVNRNGVNFSSYGDCLNRAKFQKNISIFCLILELNYVMLMVILLARILNPWCAC